MISPKVSVIIPNYNHYPYLRQRIQSVLNQTYRDFELILLDDASTDGSQDIILEYKDHTMVSKIILNERNEGNPFKQWQRGLAEARGEWIWFAESDDYADERFLEMMTSSLGGHPHAGLVYCDSRIVEKDKVKEETFASVKNKKYQTNRWSSSHHNNGLDEIENYVLPFGTINNSSAVLFNRDILTQVNPFDLGLRYIGDKYAFIKVLAKSDVVYVCDSLNYYRDPFNARSADKHLHYFYEQFLVFDFVIKNLPINDPGNFYRGFYSNTRNSFFRDWGQLKFGLYKALLRRNPVLFLKSISNNFLKSFASVFARLI